MSYNVPLADPDTIVLKLEPTKLSFRVASSGLTSSICLSAEHRSKWRVAFEFECMCKVELQSVAVGSELEF